MTIAVVRVQVPPRVLHKKPSRIFLRAFCFSKYYETKKPSKVDGFFEIFKLSYFWIKLIVVLETSLFVQETEVEPEVEVQVQEELPS